MAVVNMKYIEREFKIVELNAVSTLITECLENAVKIANNGKYDDCEFRLSINGVNLTFDKYTHSNELLAEYWIKVKSV